MKSWGIALLSLAIGSGFTYWLLEGTRPEQASGSPPPANEAAPSGDANEPDRGEIEALELDAARVRAEVDAAVAKMQERIVELEAADEGDEAPGDGADEVPEDGDAAPGLEEKAADANVRPLAPVAAGIPPAQEPQPIDFREPLDPYGEWLPTEEYGEVWQPDIGIADTSWAPYTVGSWEYTDIGWNWMSTEPWGWACYHYGRWVRLHHHGWCWVPGYEWAPAWVSWRSCDTHIGWAPLPPSAVWHVSIGFGSWVDARCDIGPGSYSFVPIAHFGASNCHRHLVGRHFNRSLILRCRNVTRICPVRHHRYRHLRVCNYGPDRHHIHRHGGRRFECMRIATHHGSRGSRNSIQRDRRVVDVHVAVTNNNVVNVAPASKKPPIRARRDSGWSSLADRGEELKLRQHYIADAKGLNRPTVKVARTPTALRPGVKDPGATLRSTRPQTDAAISKGARAEIERTPVSNPQPQPQIAANPGSGKALNVSPSGAQEGSRVGQIGQRKDATPPQVVTDAGREREVAQEVAQRKQREDGAREVAAAQQRAELERRSDEQRRAGAEQERQGKLAAQRRAQQQQAEQEAQQRQIAEARRRAEEDERQRQIAEARRRAGEEDEADRKRQIAMLEQRRRQEAEAEARRKRDEESRGRAIAEQRKRDQDSRGRAIAEQRKRDDLRRRAQEDAQRRARADAEARAVAERRKHDEEARQRSIIEARKRDDQRRRAQEEDNRRRDLARRAEDSRRKQAEEQSRRRAEDAARSRRAAEQRAAAERKASQKRAADSQKRAADSQRRAAEAQRRSAAESQRRKSSSSGGRGSSRKK